MDACCYGLLMFYPTEFLTSPNGVTERVNLGVPLVLLSNCMGKWWQFRSSHICGIYARLVFELSLYGLAWPRLFASIRCFLRSMSWPSELTDSSLYFNTVVIVVRKISRRLCFLKLALPSSLSSARVVDVYTVF